MAAWAAKKGIDILTTGDWTHPLWFREIQTQLEEANEGVYRLRSTDYSKKAVDSSQIAVSQKEPLFLLTVEVSSIYSQGGRLRRIHNLIFAPSFEIAEKIGKELHRRGVNLMSDGRPIMGLPSKSLLELILEIDRRALLVPCHAWTPWFSLYGANSGFDSIEECFGDYSKYIYGIETGLSSDPAMNWEIADLANRSILSFSDAHSPAKMGREATVFELSDVSYENVRKAIIGKQSTEDGKQITDSSEDRSPSSVIRNPSSDIRAQSSENRIAYTIEFYPEEGKYHYTGHRNCKVVQSPEETAKKGTKCPVCGRTLTVGVEHRVQELAQKTQSIGKQNTEDRSQSSVIRNPSSDIRAQSSEKQKDIHGVSWVKDPEDKRPPYVSLVPLLEILAEAQSSTTASQKVKDLYDQLTKSLGTELSILLRVSIEDIERKAGFKIAQGVRKVRERNIVVIPGYDGEYGVVKIWGEGKDVGKDVDEEGKAKENAQLGLF